MFTQILRTSPLLVSAVTLAMLMAQSTAQATSITLNSTIRDFKISHPDFEDGVSGVKTGLVGATLPASKNPTFVAANGSGAITSSTTLSQWYDDVAGVNSTITSPLTLTETFSGSGIYAYNNSSFFPIDGQLFGNQGNSHNYHFTLELHTTFTYLTGQTFNFTGDDDVWVYINNQLAMDLGGVHAAASGSVNLNTLGLTAGSTYDFDFYFAERHTTQSNLNIQTGIAFNPNPNPSPVPEPSSILLLSVGLATLRLASKKKYKSTGAGFVITHPA